LFAGRELPPDWTRPALEVWRRCYGGHLTHDEAQADLAAVLSDLGGDVDELCRRLDRYCSEVEARYATLRSFRATHGSYQEGKGGNARTTGQQSYDLDRELQQRRRSA
jgi:hypothetical protein